MNRLSGFAALSVVAVIAAACGGSSSTPTPAAPSFAPYTPGAPATAPATQSGSTTAPASMAPGSGVPVSSGPPASVAVIATVPDSELIFPGKLVICSDIPYPPQEFFDASGNPIGSDIEIGQQIAARLGLQPVILNSYFDTIIAALQGGKCDMIISAQNITTDRVATVDMIPYFQAGQSFVVAAGNPAGITSAQSLCGKKVAAETGTTEVDYLNGTGDYKGQGLSKACTNKGNPAITVTTFGKDSDALLALQTGKVDAYFADSPVAGYYVVQHPDQFALSGVTLGAALEGISVPQVTTADPSHKELEQGVQQALISMINDGTYNAILTKYGDQDGAIDAATAGMLNDTQAPTPPSP